MTTTPTPRTDERANNWESTDGQWVNADFARQLERENQTFRAAQKACEDCDAPRVDRIAELERELAAEREQVAILRSDERRLTQFAKDYRLRADEAEDQLTANHEATKLMGKWLEAERELADRLAETLRFIDKECDWNEGGDYGSVTYGDNRIGPACDKALAAWKEARSGTV